MQSEALAFDALGLAIAQLPRTVYRVKGLVHAAGDADHRHVLQAVGMHPVITIHDD